MPAELADLCIDVRCIVTMSTRGEVLEGRSLLVRDGRVLEIMPTALVKERYRVSVFAERPSHVLLPGLINGDAQAAAAQSGSDVAYDAVLRAIGAMLKSGTTCFVDRSCFPAETARAAHDQGMRTVVGLPVTEAPSPWARTAGEYLSRALQLRDEYKAHPQISTVFAPLLPNALSDATFTRLGMLANELDAGITLDMHPSEEDIAECVSQHGTRPLARMAALGLLSPGLNAVHMSSVTSADIDLSQRMGISVCACPLAGVRDGGGLPPLAALLEAGLRVGLGTASGSSRCFDLWGELRLAAAMSSRNELCGRKRAWDALALATCGAAAALSLEADNGTLQPGKWADLCCVDISAPSAWPHADPLEAALFGGTVSDVWVAGRPLLANGELTRLERAALRATKAG